jgi:hypothetical protein
MKNWNWLAVVLAFLLGLAIGKFWFSPNIIKTETEVRWKDGERITDTLREKQIVERWHRPDTTWLTKYDTAEFDISNFIELADDFFSTRGYEFDFSSDTTGIWKFDFDISRNRLVEFRKDIQPKIREEITTNYIEVKRRLQPWAIISVPTNLNGIGGTVGIDFNQKYMIGIGGQKFGEQSVFTISGRVKF